MTKDDTCALHDPNTWSASDEEAGRERPFLNDAQEWGDGSVMVEGVGLEQIWIPARQRRTLAALLLGNAPEDEA